MSSQQPHETSISGGAAEYYNPPPAQAGASQDQPGALSHISQAYQETTATVSNPPQPLQTVPGPHLTSGEPLPPPAQPPQTIPAPQAPGSEQAPPLPERPAHNAVQDGFPAYNPADYTDGPTSSFAPPPQREKVDFRGDDPSDPASYIRDPKKLIAYLVPFPTPTIKNVDPASVPKRFMIFTPPPPPLVAPKEGDKEAKLHKVQRKWQEEVRSAKTSNAKLASWKGVKSRATKLIDWGVTQTTNSNLDFLSRVSDGNKDTEHQHHDGDQTDTGEAPKKTVPVEEMVLVYPATMNMTEPQMREEFVNTMLRTKSKAQRDAIISTGLLPVAYGIDILATLVWPFGGLGEIDTVWAYSSFRGAKTARSVTKRMGSSTTAAGTEAGHPEKDQLHLGFVASPRIEVLQQYLEAECHRVDHRHFPRYASAPTETNVVEAIGWSPTHTGGEQTNWEDEQWQLAEVKEDVKTTMHKAAKEWDKWCKKFAENPEKALKK